MDLPHQILDAMVAHARFARPQEACGLLAGDATGRLRMAYCLTNVDAAPDRYTIDPVEHFRALQHAEANGWELVGAFHSHPASAPYPSPTDIALALEPDWVYVIVGVEDPATPDVRAFRICARSVTEVPIAVVEPFRGWPAPAP